MARRWCGRSAAFTMSTFQNCKRRERRERERERERPRERERERGACSLEPRASTQSLGFAHTTLCWPCSRVHTMKAHSTRHRIESVCKAKVITHKAALQPPDPPRAPPRLPPLREPHLREPSARAHSREVLHEPRELSARAYPPELIRERPSTRGHLRELIRESPWNGAHPGNFPLDFDSFPSFRQFATGFCSVSSPGTSRNRQATG